MKYSILFLMSLAIGYCAYFFARPPMISVVMSTYNRADSMPLAVESILGQTWGDFEFIIINDGSKDNTSAVLKELAIKDRRIRVLENEGNKGLVYSLNRGLGAARGKYIARMDDDDVSMPQRFERQIAYMEKNPDIAVLGTDYFLEKKGGSVVRGEGNPEKNKIRSYFQVPVFHPSVMMRLDFLQKTGIRYSQEFRSAEDTYFWYQVGRQGGRVSNLSIPLMVHGTSSVKFSGYGAQQSDSYKRFVTRTLADFMDTSVLHFPPSSHQVCYILRKMAVANERLKLFDIRALKESVEERCSKDIILFVGPYGITSYKYKNRQICQEEVCRDFSNHLDVFSWEMNGKIALYRKEDETGAFVFTEFSEGIQ